MARHSSRIFQLIAILTLAVTAACGTDGDGNGDDAIDDILAAAKQSGFALSEVRYQTVEGNGIEVGVQPVIPLELEVFQTRTSAYRIKNVYFELVQINSVDLDTTGPLTGTIKWITGRNEIEPVDSRSSSLSVTCTDVGSATFTVKVSGQSAGFGFFDQPITVPVECVASSTPETPDFRVTPTSPIDEDDVPVRLFLVGGIRYPSTQFDEDAEFWLSPDGVPAFGYDGSGVMSERDLSESGGRFNEITGLQPEEAIVPFEVLHLYCELVALALSFGAEQGARPDSPLLDFCKDHSVRDNYNVFFDVGGGTSSPDSTSPTATASSEGGPPATVDPNFVPFPDSPVSLEKGFRLAVQLQPDERRHVIGQPFTVAAQVRNATREWDPGDSGRESPLDLTVTMVSLELSPTIQLVDSSGLPFGDEGSVDAVPLAIDQVLTGQATFQCTGEELNGVIVLLARSTDETGFHHADSRERVLIRCDLPD